jgi:hypothetical protein
VCVCACVCVCRLFVVVSLMMSKHSFSQTLSELGMTMAAHTEGALKGKQQQQRERVREYETVREE